MNWPERRSNLASPQERRTLPGDLPSLKYTAVKSVDREGRLTHCLP
jgi:hypothetical protein